jgi:diguanylate cyclase (GGDEF)-like protein
VPIWQQLHAGFVTGTAPDAGGRPFGRGTLARRLAPFAFIAVAAQLSMALPPGPVSWVDALVSSLALAATAAAIRFVPWERVPEWVSVFVPFGYVFSVLYLVRATGGASSGITVVVFAVLVWTALYHRRWESIATVGAVVCFQLVSSLTPVAASGFVLFRRGVIWTVLGLVVSVGIQNLRDRLAGALAERTDLLDRQAEQLRRVEALSSASRVLTADLDPESVVSMAARLSAELADPSGPAEGRGHYVRVHNGAATFVAGPGREGELLGTSFPLSEHPLLRRAFTTGEATSGPIDPAMVGAKVSALADHVGVRHGIYVPVRVNGVVDGALVVGTETEGSIELFEECRALGHLTELALGNALAHERMRRAASTDDLTGLANRRAFESVMAHVPGRGPFAVLVIDVDELKEVNDEEGHQVGDQLLGAVAHAAKSVLRRTDVAARIGGDEFAMLCYEADRTAGEQVAARLLDVLRMARVAGRPVRVSVGVAIGYGGEDARAVLKAADRAMYRAKAAGGRRVEIASRPEDEIETLPAPSRVVAS